MQKVQGEEEAEVGGGGADVFVSDVSRGQSSTVTLIMEGDRRVSDVCK